MRYTTEKITEMAKKLYLEEKSKTRLDGWFLCREIVYKHDEEYKNLPKEIRAARELYAIVSELPISISRNSIFAGSQSDAFARTYALINPAFKVETFSGYCNPTAIFDDIEPNSEFTKERIDRVRKYTQNTEYIKKLLAVYNKYETDTEEAAYFFEQVTGHIIPDFRPALKRGVAAIIKLAEDAERKEADKKKKENFSAMLIALKASIKLAHRYAEEAGKLKENCDGEEREKYELMERTLKKVPEFPAESLYEAIQSYIILWETMCLEQAPNPYAFSVGGADRIFEPYRQMENADRELAAAYLKHLLVFFNVGDRSWAISQNLIIGGRDENGQDLTNETSYALMDAYYDMNLPQPILSAKLHKNTPDELYAEMGKFFFSEGVLTPSLFNDDSVFEILSARGVKTEHLKDYAVAGCQEPLIAGADNGNTTNSWLNLPKILELTLNSGKSLLTDKQICSSQQTDTKELLTNIREHFYEKLSYFADRMFRAANSVSEALSCLPVPFISSFMGGLSSGYDMRDTEHQGTEYNGSGCLIHGLSVLADSFVAIDHFIKDCPECAETLICALKSDFKGYDDVYEKLKSYPKFGNNIDEVDIEARNIVNRVSDIVASHKNYLGNPFRADWSTPTTHLTYGYCTGATPDGRHARDELNYGVDPLYGDAYNGMGFRVLSCMKLPFEKMDGGYASHMGIDPKYFKSETKREKGLDFANRIIRPLFFNPKNKNSLSPYYLYVNVTTPETLRKVLANPQKYAPSGVYIMRIHGTFVNFLDLSPAVQQDIIMRLDPQSTLM